MFVSRPSRLFISDEKRSSLDKPSTRTVAAWIAASSHTIQFGCGAKPVSITNEHQSMHVKRSIVDGANGAQTVPLIFRPLLMQQCKVQLAVCLAPEE